MNTKVIKAGIYYSVAVTTDRMGRMSVVVYDNSSGRNNEIVDVELPQQSKRAEYPKAFKPTVKVHPSIDIEKLPE